MRLHSFGLDLDPMNLVLKLDLDIVKMYVYTENEVQWLKRYRLNKYTDKHKSRHTDRHD